ncbi:MULTISPECIES: 2-hydroxychromene-2-carboxylate isomerase [Sphingomonadales]|uniref:2-hydroxychromene-2-carboxylate isomerase n=2 Tax=Sphingomonadales TaxID=204457 RepID=A0A0G3XN71_9SPHN|nr:MULTISPECIES: 2-hydroxychromene-2-carboxylate isomerase [Sphingomonadales]EZP70120.1 putative 2-hydroxychromene-2-carboxylate isomerase [Sphingomonas paucimobilis]AIT82629.1 DSBA oxidoreductase [Novosphingobium pentaromativorans US6-1]AKM12071.1 DSBA oxidoreductase [Croceicoccus naphthovorans]EHJ58007.1 putative 2-hydroxychromene-2-carboxylate isomerase [Novosphingobium pentaromativorans US6-1]MBB3992063.1 2-hydroxychromene-2-carboxylate isomerase [Croceicoccus naphthovorans]
MTRKIDFYFDFISPFSYLAQLKLPEIARKAGCELEYWPIDIPEAKIAAGNYGPSNREVVPKIKVMMADLNRWARKYDAPLRFPASFACKDWNCATLYAREQGKAGAFVAAAYNRIWGQGIDPSDREELRACAAEAGLDAEALTAFVDSSLGQNEYRKVRSQAYQRGVFGAPLMFVDDEIFWGNDRLEFLEEYLEK